MSESEIVVSARVIWDYFSSFRNEQPCDALVVCGSYDLRVMDHATKLLHQGLSKKIVITGNTGNWTKHIWTQSEAKVFYEHSKTEIPSDIDVVLETKASNFGENISFSRSLLPDAKNVLLLTKPNAVLRVLLTAQKQWPNAVCFVSSPIYRFPEEVSNVVGFLGLLDEMVGDVDRIRRYPELGFQVEHELPIAVQKAADLLIRSGFDNHLSG